MVLRWLFLDMNSFFASCEQHDRPELRGRPVGVCPVLAGGSGAVIAASYEAKARGVSMGCREAEARQRCPEITLLQARPDRYVELHHAVADSIQKHLPITRGYSIDEWAMRLVAAEQPPDAARRLAQRIKDHVRRDFEGALPCSIGIAPTRLLAKTACELHKPDGLTIIQMHQMPGIVDARMQLGDIPGIGEGMEKRLRLADVPTVAALWELTKADCRRIWGSVNGEYFWCGLHGVDVEEVKTHRSSVGHAHILPPELRHPEAAYGILTRLTCKAAVRLRYMDYVAHHLRVHVSFTSPLAWSDEIALPAVQDTPTILQHLARLNPLQVMQRAGGFEPDHVPGSSIRPTDPPKKVSVELAGLTPLQQTTGHLFHQADRPQKLSETLDTINRKFGGHKIHPATMQSVAGYKMDDKIAFGRVPEEWLKM